MEYTIVNGASALARGVSKYLGKNASKFRLLDYRAFRPGVYRWQKELDVPVEKHQTQSSAAMEYAMEGSDTVVYFTHDYVSMAHGKGNTLESAAKIAKHVGVEKIVFVCPIEHDMYYAEEEKDPIKLRAEHEANAFAHNPNFVLLRPNLVFGDYTYFIRYMSQSVLAGKMNSDLTGTGDSTEYYPVHLEDLSNAINHSLEHFDSAKGHTFSVKGHDAVTLGRLKSILEGSAGESNTGSAMNLGIGNFFGEFFYGISHDKNMGLMAKYYRNHHWDFNNEDCYLDEHDIKHDHRIEKYFEDHKLRSEDFTYPTFCGYKKANLD